MITGGNYHFMFLMSEWIYTQKCHLPFHILQKIRHTCFLHQQKSLKINFFFLEEQTCTYCSTQLNSIGLHTWSQWEFPLNSWLLRWTHVVTIGSVGLLWPRLPTDLDLSPRERWLRKQDRHVPREPFPIMDYDTRHPSILHSFRGSFSMSSQVLHAVPNIRADSSLVRSIHNTFDMTNVFLLFFFFFLLFVLDSHLPHVTREGGRTRTRLGCILQVFGFCQDGVDVWDGVILKDISSPINPCSISCMSEHEHCVL